MPGKRKRSDVVTVRPRFANLAVAVTPGRAEAFLAAVETGSEDGEAAEFANVSLTAVRRRLREDPDFRRAYQVARENRLEVYRGEAKRRAVDGWLEPVFFRGEQVGQVRKFSDRLLEVLLRAEGPEEFGERRTIEVLTAPMTGQDVAKAVALGAAAGQSADFLAALELVASKFADDEVLETVERNAGEFEVEAP